MNSAIFCKFHVIVKMGNGGILSNKIKACSLPQVMGTGNRLLSYIRFKKM